MKEWYKSRTLWLAVIQGIAGIVIAWQVEFPVADLGGYTLILKSMIDILLRLKTDERITK